MSRTKHDEITAASEAKSGAFSQHDILNLLIKRIDVQHKGVGIVVGVMDGDGRRVVSHGVVSQDDPRPLDGDTAFEIGSLTKGFTSLLLADMVHRGEVALDDPVVKYLPPGVTMPGRGGKQITLIDLATHTSGLPRLPGNYAPRDLTNPNADYSVEQLYEFLSTYQLPRDIAVEFEYSNLGVGLLGHVLALRAGTDFETVMRQRVLTQLGMSSTAITLSATLKARVAKGHDQDLRPTPSWDMPTLAGAGGLISTANDLLRFLAAALAYVATPLEAAIATQIATRRPTGTRGLETALGWNIFTNSAGEAVLHNGRTGGYRSFMGFDPRARVGVVVLSNASTAAGDDDIGLSVLKALRAN
jgi:serine-type D-Ala-D-Ala carboxypeptidase/endopeptidase